MKSSSFADAAPECSSKGSIGFGERAATVVEYAMLLCLVSFLVFAAVVSLGEGTSSPIKRTGTAVNGAEPAPPLSTSTTSSTTTTTTTIA